MKRRRYEMEQGSEIKSAIEELSMFPKLNICEDDDNHETANIPTKPFLSVCRLIIQVLDKIGPTMAVLRQDIHHNIQRLEKFCESDPIMYSNLVEVLKKEKSEGIARKGASCSKSFIWLTRSMNFMVELLQRLGMDPGQTMEQAVEESYIITLKPWHGWISSAAFKVALKLVPDNKTFTSLLIAKDETFEILKGDIETLVSLLVPILEDIQSILIYYGLEKTKST